MIKSISVSKFTLFYALILSTFSLAAQGQSQTAKAQLLMFEQDGCFYCEKWNEDIGSYFDTTVEGKKAPLQRMDIHTPMPAGLEQFDAINLTPTFVVVVDNEEIGRIPGYIDQDFFWGYLNQILAKVK
ncbi:MAG: thioredoxin fold domain-containing protein [Alphaproteobacteria bacterium]